MKNNSGFSLVELMIAVGLLGGIVAGYMQLNQSSMNSQREIMDRGNINLSMRSVKNDVLADSAFIPPYPLNVFNENTNNPADFFANHPGQVAFRCYDRFGLRNALTVENCTLGDNIQTWFFKASVLDNSIAKITDSSDKFYGKSHLARIPLSRFYFKVTSSVGVKNKAKIITFYFSSLKTDTNNF